MAFCLNTSTAFAIAPISSRRAEPTDLDRRIALRQATHRRGHRADRRGDAANDRPANTDAEQGGQGQYRQNPTMRRCAKLRSVVGSLRALTHVQIDVGLQSRAERGHRVRRITQEQRDRLLAFALRLQLASASSVSR